MVAKTAGEKDILREGGRRLATILRRLAATVAPGVSTDELDTLALRLIREGDDEPAFLHYTPEGAERPYPATLCVSINDEVVHGIPNEKPRIFMEGDVVGLDLGLAHKGLIVDAALTVVAGQADREALRLIETTKKALAAGIKAARGGAHIGDVSAAIEEVGKGAGYGSPRELGGHGVGHHVHEQPHIPNFGKPGKGEVLTPGMVLALEPMLNEGTGAIEIDKDGYTIRTRDGKRSAHFEHTILITEGEPEVLTR